MIASGCFESKAETQVFSWVDRIDSRSSGELMAGDNFSCNAGDKRSVRGRQKQAVDLVTLNTVFGSVICILHVLDKVVVLRIEIHPNGLFIWRELVQDATSNQYRGPLMVANYNLLKRLLLLLNTSRGFLQLGEELVPHFAYHSLNGRPYFLQDPFLLLYSSSRGLPIFRGANRKELTWPRIKEKLPLLIVPHRSFVSVLRKGDERVLCDIDRTVTLRLVSTRQGIQGG